MKAPLERRGGGAARYALPIAVLILMIGLVLAVNPGQYGWAVSALGIGLAVVGGALAVGLFRAARADPGGAVQPRGDEEDGPEGVRSGTEVRAE